MPDSIPTSDQFWLLTSEAPAGPFTVAQIHAMLAAGTATWQTPACPVGGSQWLPLTETPGIGPTGAANRVESSGYPPADRNPGPTARTEPGNKGTAPPDDRRKPSPALPSAGTPGPPPLPACSATSGAEERKTQRIGAIIGGGLLVAAVFVVGAVGYGFYELIPPSSATEVCKKLAKAKTPAEAKQYATPRMHAVVDALFADATDDPNSTTELTQEVDGPRPDTKLVGCRGTVFVPEEGKRVRVEARFLVVKSNGWKVDDLIITGVGGSSLPCPLSLAEEHAPPLTATAACRRFNAAGSASEAKKCATPHMYPLIDALAADKSAADPNDAFEITQEVDGGNPGTKRVGFRGSWYDAPAARRQRVEGHFRVVNSGGWRVDDIVFTDVEGVALPSPMSLVDEYRRTAPPTTAKSSTELPNQLPPRQSSSLPKLAYTDTRPWYEKYKYFVVFAVLGLMGAIGKAWSRWTSTKRA